MPQNQTSGEPVTELIRRRTSWRSYDGQMLSAETRHQLEELLAADHPTPFGSPLRFRLIAATPEDSEALRGLGTYGFISGAPAFIVGAVGDEPMALEDYGYALERIILKSVELGLQSCWLGGSFNRSAFAKRFGLAAGETIPAITPVGHGMSERGLVDRLIRKAAGSQKRKEWSDLFFRELAVESTPLTADSADQFAEPLEMLRLAPSASNKQPWRIVMARDTTDSARLFHFALQRTPGYHKQSGPLKMADLQRIDIGIAMAHFELSCSEAGIGGSWIHKESVALDSKWEYRATFRAESSRVDNQANR